MIIGKRSVVTIITAVATVATICKRWSKPMAQDDDNLREHLLAHLEWGPAGEDRTRFLSLALAAEAGELANIVKKDWRDGGNRRDEIVAELADIGNYALMLAMHLDVDIRAEMVKKLLAVEQRPAWKERPPKGENPSMYDQLIRGQ